MLSINSMEKATASEAERVDKDIQSLIERETVNYLHQDCRRTYDENITWERNYSSLKSFNKSGNKYRDKWEKVLGLVKFGNKLKAHHEPYFENSVCTVELLTLRIAPGLNAYAALALPKEGKGPFPLIIAQQGKGSTPSRVFGIRDSEGIYHSYGIALAAAGYAVLSPITLKGGEWRCKAHYISLMAGKTIAGFEISKLCSLLDYIETLKSIDSSRIAMWGISQGGTYTLFTSPIEKRIKVAIITAWFNERFGKMITPSPLYSSFINTEEHDVWLPGWFSDGFSDSNLVSLICPRPVQIQQGKADGIGWHEYQKNEFFIAKKHYGKLKIPDQIEYIDHSGGHEICLEEGIDFLQKWL